MYFIISSWTRNPTQAGNNVFCVLFDTGFPQYDGHNVACRINDHE